MLAQLAKLAVTALIDTRGSAKPKDIVGQWPAAACFALGTVIIAVTTLGFALAALWAFAYSFIDAVGASLVTCGAVAFLWIPLFLITKKAPTIQSPSTDIDLVALVDEAQHLFDQNKTAVIVAALLAGFLAGNTDRTPGQK